MPNVVLGISGSVAAYRAADLARDLMRRGFTVRACLTDGGAAFVTTALFEALTGQPCLQHAFEEPERGRMAHIDWAKEAEVLAVAPATANVLAKLAHGVADDMLTTLAVAHRGALLVAPAMNPAMYASETVQASLRILADRGAVVVDPDVGVVACGDTGQGKFAPIERIAEAIAELAARSTRLAGQRVLITSGPTREPLDHVRYLTNRSSGRMGAALARAALQMGAEVDVVSGPVEVAYPFGANVVRVGTACEMLDAALPLAGRAGWIIGAAAVADYRPAQIAAGKLRRTGEPMTLELESNPDVLAALARQAKPGAVVVGFAAEPDSSLDEARAKLARKGLTAIVANDVSAPGIGFGSESNALTLLRPGQPDAASGVRSKLACALWLFERLAPA
jgi:phosphopantothenoylcysteine decarboxylase/phosphopantothenate--cysteine ligase